VLHGRIHITNPGRNPGRNPARPHRTASGQWTE
jgi:hypothetical protein